MSYKLNLGKTKLDEIQFGEHSYGGVHAVVLFPNLFGASIVGGVRGLYGNGKTSFEVGIIQVENPDDPHSWDLTFDTPITDDVLGWRSIEEVEQILEQVAKL